MKRNYKITTESHRQNETFPCIT